MTQLVNTIGFYFLLVLSLNACSYHKENIIPIYAIANKDNVKCYKWPDKSTVKQSAKFLEIFEIIENSKNSKYVLLKHPEKKLKFLILKDDLLLSQYALHHQNKYSFRKAIIKNNFISQSTQKDVSVYSGPGNTFQSLDRVNISKITFVYDVQKGNDGNEYVLIGDKPVYDSNTPNVSLKGWVDISNCIMWNNRLAVSFQPDSIYKDEPVFVLEKKIDLENFINTRKVSNAISYKKILISAKNDIRYPVLDIEGNSLQIAFIDTPLTLKGKEELYLIKDRLTCAMNYLLSSNDNQQYIKYSSQILIIMIETLKRNICQKGWISRGSLFGNHFPLKWYIMLDRYEIDEILAILAGFIHLQKSIAHYKQKTIEQVIYTITGKELPSDLTIARFFQKEYHIPIWHISLSLHLTASQLANVLHNSDDFKTIFFKEIQRSYEQFHLIQEGKKGDLFWKPSQKRWVVNNIEKKEWFCSQESDYSFAWIPLEYLP